MQLKPMGIRLLPRVICLIYFALLTGCTLYPQEKFDAELFLPMIQGLEDTRETEGFEYTRHTHAYRISKALEYQYIATVLEKSELRHSCSGGKPSQMEDDLSVRITRILQPFEWEPLLDNKGVFKNAVGGVLFGQGVRLSDASLLSLRYVLSPVDDQRYTWTAAGLTFKIPYRYIEFEEIALSDRTERLFKDPMPIYRTAEPDSATMCEPYEVAKKCKPECHVCDDIEVFINSNTTPVISGDLKRVPIEAIQKTGIWLSDGNSLSPVLYRFPRKTVDQGWIDIINLSAFPTEAEGAYMEIVRSLTLAQAGDCDSAYTIYKEKIEDTESKNKEQVLTIIAHISGQSGEDISAVLCDLARIRGTGETGEKDPLIETYLKMTNKNELMCPSIGLGGLSHRQENPGLPF